MNQQFTVITGASGGLGRSLMVECASRGMNLILTSLPGEGLADLGGEIRQKYGVNVEIFETDLSDRLNISEFVQWVKENFSVNFLINNVGIGCSLPSIHTSTDLIDRIIDLNVRPTAIITHELLPLLASQPSSYILNVSSIIGMYPCPYKTVYPASKSFVYSYSRGLRQELQDTSISVSVIIPGPFASNPEVTEQIRGQSFLGRLSQISSDQIARQAIRKTLHGKPVIIPGPTTKFIRFIMRIVPESLGLRLLTLVYKKDAFRFAEKRRQSSGKTTLEEAASKIKKTLS